MTEPLRPVPPVQIEPPTPARRVERSHDQDAEGGSQPDERREEKEEDGPDEGDDGLHVDVLA